MKLSSLLAQRQSLLEKARLANLAFAYARLSDFAQRIARGRLCGEVRLHAASPDAQRYWPTLTALEGSQSVLDEHFSEEDLADLVDVLTYVGSVTESEQNFRMEELEPRFCAPLRDQLGQAGIIIDGGGPAGEVHGGSSADCSRRDDQL